MPPRCWPSRGRGSCLEEEQQRGEPPGSTGGFSGTSTEAPRCCPEGQGSHTEPPGKSAPVRGQGAAGLRCGGTDSVEGEPAPPEPGGRPAVGVPGHQARGTVLGPFTRPRTQDQSPGSSNQHSHPAPPPRPGPGGPGPLKLTWPYGRPQPWLQRLHQAKGRSETRLYCHLWSCSIL